MPETVFLLDVFDSSLVTSLHIYQWTAKDLTLTKVQDAPLTGNIPDGPDFKPYEQCWSELSVEQQCVLRGIRIVIPTKGHKAVINLLHEGHPGGTRMKALA